MSHQSWLPCSRLVYGVFLSNTILMQYRILNAENGLWLSRFDLYLLFLAFLTLSFLFSFFMYLAVEGPMASLADKLRNRPSQAPSRAPTDQRAQRYAKTTPAGQAEDDEDDYDDEEEGEEEGEEEHEYEEEEDEEDFAEGLDHSPGLAPSNQDSDPLPGSPPESFHPNINAS